LHIGLAGEGRTFNRNEQLRFSSNQGTTLAPALQRSQAIQRLDTMRAWNGEIALGMGRVLVQGQVIAMRIDRHSRSTLHFFGHYMQASWMLTGEH
jgi:phosphate-selective porin